MDGRARREPGRPDACFAGGSEPAEQCRPGGIDRAVARGICVDCRRTHRRFAAIGRAAPRPAFADAGLTIDGLLGFCPQCGGGISADVAELVRRARDAPNDSSGATRIRLVTPSGRPSGGSRNALWAIPLPGARECAGAASSGRPERATWRITAGDGTVCPGNRRRSEDREISHQPGSGPAGNRTPR